ncbi:hypothetical protein [Methylobacterium sp. J-077]|uniref:hypothetical protein n=1 Tax=Methylobacterium sp. J-077 TaxID=2836656 RepID=UPI001FBA5A45|nr:hypothetical protein [Methylobacterium sp. J-077]MCJ2124909.1 hypothetical protein [Methylobacterium sp. J-077]
MPKRLPDPILDDSPSNAVRRSRRDDYLDLLTSAAQYSVDGHPQLGGLDPDKRFRNPTGRQRPAVWAPAVMAKALKRTSAGKTMNAKARREVIRAILESLIDNKIDLIGADERDRNTTEANSYLLMVASGCYALEGERLHSFRAVNRQPPVLPSSERAYVYEQPIPEEAEEAPDIDAMLAMMGNLPPMSRNGH